MLSILVSLPLIQQPHSSRCWPNKIWCDKTNPRKKIVLTFQMAITLIAIKSVLLIHTHHDWLVHWVSHLKDKFCKLLGLSNTPHLLCSAFFSLYNVISCYFLIFLVCSVNWRGR
jgi:hypothetical protein